MTKFDKEELLNIAELSSLKLNEQEADVLVNEIKLFLDYTEELNQVKLAKEVSPVKNVNVFREDVAVKTDSSNLLAQSPQTKNNYFVVPKVLKSNLSSPFGGIHNKRAAWTTLFSFSFFSL